MTLQELKQTLVDASLVVVLTDENVAPLWIPELKHWLACEEAMEIVIPGGEQSKTLAMAQRIWKKLLRRHADRDTILVNLGGGVITDLGGFVASCYQRGIRFVNVPTTLLAMVDAAIGGKTGVDFNGGKNQIGTFAEPLEVLVSPIYLSTLPQREILSGLAEMLKYGYVADSSMLNVNMGNYEQYLLRAGRIKREIVALDPTDHGERMVLNFGHTLGHAIESWSLANDHPLRHGEAVALGMGCALWISHMLTGLSDAVVQDYWPKMRALLAEAEFTLGGDDLDEVLSFLTCDKKSHLGENRFVLLRSTGAPVIDQAVPDELVRQSLLEVIDKLS